MMRVENWIIQNYRAYACRSGLIIMDSNMFCTKDIIFPKKSCYADHFEVTTFILLKLLITLAAAFTGSASMYQLWCMHGEILLRDLQVV